MPVVDDAVVGAVDVADAGVPPGAEDEGNGNNGAAGLADPDGTAAGFELGTFSFGISIAGLLGCADVEAGAKPNEGTLGCGAASGFLVAVAGADAAPNGEDVVTGGAVDAGAVATLACCCCFSLILDIAAASRSCFSHFE